MKKKLEELQKLLSAIIEATKIADEISHNRELLITDEYSRQMMINYNRDTRELCKNLPQKYFNKTSIGIIVSDFLTYYNEGGGPDVDEFWRRVQEAGLPFERKDVLGNVLKRDRIRTRSEYDIVVDTAIPASQTGRITEEQCLRLLQLAEEYEQRASKRRR